MSLFKSIGRALKPVAKAALPALAGIIPGGQFAVPILTAAAAAKPRALPAAAPAVAAGASRVLPAIGRALTGGAVGAGARVAVRSAKSIYNSAASYCRRHPQWCATVGGIAAVEALVSNGQLPVIKRRRRKGITARELGSFTRVARIFKRYCGVARTARTPRKRC